MTTRQVTIDDKEYTAQKSLLWHQKAGLSFTPTGYGSKIPTSWIVKMADNRTRRIYCCVYSNIGTCYVLRGGKRIIVHE